MKKIFFFFALIFILCSWAQPAAAQSPQSLTIAEAEKIMGEPARLTDSSSEYENGVHHYRSSYSAQSKDSVTGRIGKLYYMYEEYDKTSDAQKYFTDIKAANAKNNVLKDLPFGDEGYYQRDASVLHFIMVRKGNKILIFKVNKITRWTSPNALMDIAKNKVSML